MGYCSQTMLVIDKDLVPHFMVATSGCPKTQAFCFQDSDVFEQDYNGEGAMLFYWTRVKWIEGYNEIDLIEKFLADCEYEGTRTSLKFRFIRIGEDYDDIVDRGDCFWDIEVQRTINF